MWVRGFNAIRRMYGRVTVLMVDLVSMAAFIIAGTLVFFGL